MRERDTTQFLRWPDLIWSCSVLVGAALVSLRVVLVVGLHGVVKVFEVVAGIAGCSANLHLVPRRPALTAHRIIGARILRFLDALCHHLG